MRKFEEQLLRCPYCQSHASTTLISALFTRKCYSCKNNIKVSVYGITIYFLFLFITGTPIIVFCVLAAIYIFNLEIVKKPLLNLGITSVSWFILSVGFCYQWIKLAKKMVIKLNAQVFIKPTKTIT